MIPDIAGAALIVLYRAIPESLYKPLDSCNRGLYLMVYIRICLPSG